MCQRPCIKDPPHSLIRASALTVRQFVGGGEGWANASFPPNSWELPVCLLQFILRLLVCTDTGRVSQGPGFLCHWYAGQEGCEERSEGSRLHLTLPHLPPFPHCATQHHKISLSATEWLCWVPNPMSPVTALTPTLWETEGVWVRNAIEGGQPLGRSFAHVSPASLLTPATPPPLPGCCELRESPLWPFRESPPRHRSTGQQAMHWPLPVPPSPVGISAYL